MTRIVILVAVLAFAVAAPGGLAAQPWPSRPVKLLVGGAGGSVPDTLARQVAEPLSASLGQPVIVDNRPGAAGIIAMDALVKSAPDGHTVALATMSQAVFNSYLFTKLPYDPQRDLEPVAVLATGAMALAAHPSFPAQTFGELVAMAKAQPARIFMALPANGSPPHVIALLMLRAAGIDVALVPHKSGQEALVTVLSGQTQLFLDAPTIMSAHIKAGKLKALAVTGRQRETVLPDVPTLAELGLSGVHGEAWIGLVTSRGTAGDTVRRLNAEIAKVLAQPAMRDILTRLSFRPMPMTPEQFRALIKDEHARWSGVIRDAGLRVD